MSEAYQQQQNGVIAPSHHCLSVATVIMAMRIRTSISRAMPDAYGAFCKLC